MFIAGQSVRLRPVIPDDYPVLSRWCFTHKTFHYLARRMEARLFSESGSGLETILAGSMVLMIVDRAYNPMGYAVLFDVNPRDRHMHLDVFTMPQCPATVRMEAWLLLLDHVLAWFPVEKVYRQLPEFASSEYPIAMSMGFEEEGFLRDVLWFGDRFWGIHTLALSRERWSQSRGVFIDDLTIQARYESLAGQSSESEPGKRIDDTTT